ncbi:twin-arginine translocase subunit TatC [Natronorubrum daqingense]|uniref:Sec-independent protein translocase protein TatC n=1 Tax=Natronorubrum daqingense TaxID=588898 RepID=A0A1N7ENA0_9EURY|nr:translocase [Natronorubrum daqingense]SIR89563.1 sec-independent protein translocase protein TatC [Natronorubrum daqingense]
MSDEPADDMAVDDPASDAEGSTETDDEPLPSEMDGEEDPSADEDAERSTESDAASDGEADDDSGAEADNAEADDESDDEADGAETDDNADDAEGDDADQSIETDGEGYVQDRPDSAGEPVDPLSDDVGGISTPPDDEEMPLADHIEEMVLRFAVVILVGAAGTAIGLLFASQGISYVWDDIFPGAAENAPPPHIYHPLELWLTRIKFSALLGIMMALPVFVYQCYRFMRPGLYPNERKYYLAAVPMSVVLAALGMLFSYVLVLPILFEYFTFYAEGSADIAYALGETFDLVITLTGFLAIVFQIPLFIMLAIMMGVTTRRWLADKRLYFWAAFFGLSFMFTMDPTMMAPILVAITMIMLFEGTLLVLKWVGKE